MSVNYFVDPANLFSQGRYEAGIAQHLSEGNHVTNVLNYDERLLQKYFINDLSNCPEEIVLGSSRVMQINEDYKTTRKLINNGVSGATLEDHLAIFDLYEKKGCQIKKIIIGVDPWILNDYHDQKRWKTLAKEYNEQLKKISSGATTNTEEIGSGYVKYYELFSFSYFKTSLDYLRKGIDKNYHPTKQAENKYFTRLTDGSIYYDDAYREVTVEEINNRARETTSINPIYSLRDFSKISENYKLILENFIGYLQKKGIEVVFFLAPYHPMLYDYFRQNKTYHIVFEIEKYFREFGKSHNINTIGSYDPAVYNFDPSFFYDGYHCKENAIRIIMDTKNN